MVRQLVQSWPGENAGEVQRRNTTQELEEAVCFAQAIPLRDHLIMYYRTLRVVESA